MNYILTTIQREIRESFQSIWDKISLFHPREAMAIGNGIIGILILIVGYERPDSNIVGVHIVGISWQVVPTVLIFCMYILANPLRKPLTHTLATLPLLGYGIFLMGQVWAGRVEVENVLPAMYAFLFAVLGLLVVRRYYDEDIKDHRIAELECKVLKLNRLLNSLPSEDYKLFMGQALSHEPASTPNNP